MVKSLYDQTIGTKAADLRIKWTTYDDRKQEIALLVQEGHMPRLVVHDVNLLM